MKRENICDALNLLPDELLEEAGRVRERKRRYKRPPRWLAAAACLCLLLWGAVDTLDRFDYTWGCGCGAFPGAIVDGAYYYKVRHSGVWRYTPEGGRQKLLSTYWEDGWKVNDYGIYYQRGRSLYVREHETGERRRLFTADRADCTHIGFALLRDGGVVVTCYDRDAAMEYELLLDGRTGEVLETVTEPTSYKAAHMNYSDAVLMVGGRRLQLVLTEDGWRCDLVEDGARVLPKGMFVHKYYDALYCGDSLLIPVEEEDEDEDALEGLWLLLRPDGGDELLTLPLQRYQGGTDGYLFYTAVEYTEDGEAMDAILCLEVATGETWELEQDTAWTVHDFTTDGAYLYSTVPWGDSHTCWRVEYDGGKPVGLTLVCEDIQED